MKPAALRKTAAQHLALAGLALCLATAAHAKGTLPEFYNGVRAMGMGDAYTAIADDADALFYNPAGLALAPKFEFRLLNPKFDVSKDDLSTITSLRSTSGGLDAPTISKLFGKHLYGDVNATPMIMVPGFAVGYYYDIQTHVVARNLSLPAVDASYTRDRGLVAGAAHEFKLGAHQYLRFGLGAKWLTREGFAQTIPITQLVVANKSYIKNLQSASGTGWGATVGAQYELGLNRRSDIILGAAFQDVGDTSFGNSLAANPPPMIPGNLSAGAAYVFRFNQSHRAMNNFKLTAELRHLETAGLDPRLRIHAGAELQIGDLSIQAGLNQDSLCAGAKLDLLFMEVAAVTYGVEDQSLAFQDRERRYMLQLTFKFDIMGKTMRPERDKDRIRHPRAF